MTTGSDVVRAGFFRAGIRGAETPLTAEEHVNGYEILIDMLNEWQASGVNLAFVVPASSASELIVPNAALAAIKCNLAVKINNAYQRPPNIGLINDATESFQAMLVALKPVITTAYPAGLSRGVANNLWGSSDPFYNGV